MVFKWPDTVLEAFKTITKESVNFDTGRVMKKLSLYGQ